MMGDRRARAHLQSPNSHPDAKRRRRYDLPAHSKSRHLSSILRIPATQVAAVFCEGFFTKV